MPYPFEITQSQGDILFAYTYDTATRIVLMTKHRDAELDTWMGTNNGHWEGDTLVIDATGFNGSSTNAGSLGTFNNFDGAGARDRIFGSGGRRGQRNDSAAGHATGVPAGGRGSHDDASA